MRGELRTGRSSSRTVTSVKVVYEVCRIIRFPMIVYAASVPETGVSRLTSPLSPALTPRPQTQSISQCNVSDSRQFCAIIRLVSETVRTIERRFCSVYETAVSRERQHAVGCIGDQNCGQWSAICVVRKYTRIGVNDQ